MSVLRLGGYRGGGQRGQEDRHVRGRGGAVVEAASSALLAWLGRAAVVAGGLVAAQADPAEREAAEARADLAEWEAPEGALAA